MLALIATSSNMVLIRLPSAVNQSIKPSTQTTLRATLKAHIQRVAEEVQAT